jgi:zinc protease
MVVAALAAKDCSENGWRSVMDALVEDSGDMVCEVSRIVSHEAEAAIRFARPRYVAFVMKPEEITETVVRSIRRMMCRIDDDPFDDAIWGIVTGPTPEDAKRVALCSSPRDVTSVLATTGVGEDIVPGPVTVVSDANPPGEWWAKDSAGVVSRHSATGNTSSVFADAWDRQDPDLLLTSSHASERNLEMPFSRGNIVAYDGSFAVVENLTLIDYSTGQAVKRIEVPVAVRRLSSPRREKVWLAAGNCLIANHKQDGDDMVMCALGFGRVNQFVGYIKTTWFGEIGWNTWRYFGGYGFALNESWYAANQVLIKKLKVDGSAKDENEWLGLEWDYDGTVFYGNPRRMVTVPGRTPGADSKDGDLPLLVVFPDSRPDRRLVSAPEGFEVFVADDFAFVTSWRDLPADWRARIIFSDGGAPVAMPK